jgi:hypothetical protein
MSRSSRVTMPLDEVEPIKARVKARVTKLDA